MSWLLGTVPVTMEPHNNFVKLVMLSPHFTAMNVINNNLDALLYEFPF